MNMINRFKGQYPDNWLEIALEIKNNAGWRCERCGHPHETPTNRKPCDKLCHHPIDGKQRILTIHHLNGDKSDCSWYNLACLCQRCHLTIQAKVIMERFWMFGHSAWFVPHVAGYYAHIMGLSENRNYVIENADYIIQEYKDKVLNLRQPAASEIHDS